MIALVGFSTNSSAKTLTVAVIDTGIDESVSHLCKQGHKDFTGDNSPKTDLHGHGTHIAGLIVKHAENQDFCLVSLRYYKESNSGQTNLQNTLAALRHAIAIKVDFINYSAGGDIPNDEEQKLISQALKQGITVVVAAGNEKSNLDKECNYFPACYQKKGLVVVGNLQIVGDPNLSLSRAPSSNYGSPVNRWEVGTNVISNLPHGKIGFMSGTSQATAIATGRLVKERHK